MRALAKAVLAVWLILALAGAAGAAEGFSLRSDGWYAPPQSLHEVLDYSIPYAVWLEGDQISTSTWTYTSGITHGAESINQAKTITTTWLWGGTAKQTYTVTNTIQTVGGRTWVYTFKIEVK